MHFICFILTAEVCQFLAIKDAETKTGQITDRLWEEMQKVLLEVQLAVRRLEKDANRQLQRLGLNNAEDNILRFAAQCCLGYHCLAQCPLHMYLAMIVICACALVSRKMSSTRWCP